MQLFNPILKLEKKRQSLIAKRSFNLALEKLFLAKIPDPNTKLKDLDILSIDFETTGLNFKNDSILSIGGVNISNLQIDFKSSFHHYVKISHKIKNDTAIINQITYEQLISGLDLNDVLDILINKMAGKLILSHCHVIEKNFFLQALGLPENTFLPLIFIDTMIFEKTILRHNNESYDISLSGTRKRYNLPAYNAHNALADSVATAELFLAQLKKGYANKDITLIDLYKRLH